MQMETMALSEATTHTTPETFDEAVTPLWPTLRAAAAQFPTTTVCGHCGSEKIHWSEFEDRDSETGESFALSGMYCPDCGAMEEPADRNDLAEAFLIAGSHPLYPFRRVPNVERRHLMALVSHCVHLMERQGVRA